MKRPQARTEGPEYFRDHFPYSALPRVGGHGFAKGPYWLTDTTFRDGRQARPPYTVEQTVRIFTLLHELAGRSGIVRTSEFFLYSKADRTALDRCRELGFTHPEVIGWIRADKADVRLAADMGLSTVGMLMSVSDYHTHLKLGMNRKQAFDACLTALDAALDLGLTPNCHFEDATRADVHGFCIPLAQAIMDRAKQVGKPIRIRLCDTLGLGLPFEAALPRSVPRLVRAFVEDGGVPGQQLEWHGHNDFHLVTANALAAWLSGLGGINGTLFGFGERSGNTPLEAMLVHWIGLTGDDAAVDLGKATELAEYFQRELGWEIPPNWPLFGRDAFLTRAGLHADGLLKNEAIYAPFDSGKLLGRPPSIAVTDKSGRAGAALWVNSRLSLSGKDVVDKRDPGIEAMHRAISAAYALGRSTAFSEEELFALARKHLPERFLSDFERLRREAFDAAAHLVEELAHKAAPLFADPARLDELLTGPFPGRICLQLLYATDAKGLLAAKAPGDPSEAPLYRDMTPGMDFSEREWFIQPMSTGRTHVTGLYQSRFTGRLCLTVSTPVRRADDRNGPGLGVLGADLRLEELLNRRAELADALNDLA